MQIKRLKPRVSECKTTGAGILYFDSRTDAELANCFLSLAYDIVIYEQKAIELSDEKTQVFSKKTKATEELCNLMINN